jgi:hypothetical protein
MVKKMKRVELKVDTNLVAPGDEVILRANLSDLELEDLRIHRGHIQYWVDGTLIADKQIAADQSDPRSATWTPGSLPGFGEHKATVKVLIKYKDKTTDTEIATGETAIYVSPGTNLALWLSDDHVLEGTSIELTVGVPSGSPPALSPPPRELEDAGVHIDWETGNKGTVEPRGFAKAIWHTGGMNAGTHTVTARLVDRNTQVLTTARGPVAPTASARIQTTH